MAGPERFGYYDASPREKPKEDKSTMAKRFIEAAKQVIKKIEEQKKSTSKKEASTAEKEKTARFSKDIASFVEEKPKIKEIRRGIESEKRPPKHIEITEQTKKKLESLTVRITPDGKTEYKEQALVFSETDFTDERSAQLAIAYLEKAELAETAKDEERSTKAAQNIRETAENLWRLSVGSGYTNRGATEARSMMFGLYNSVSKNDVHRLNSEDQKYLMKDLGILIQTSKYPPSLSLPEYEEGFGQQAKDFVLAFNVDFSDYFTVEGLSVVEQQDGTPIVLNSTNIQTKLDELKKEWSEYVKQYKKDNGGKEPPDEEKKLFETIQKDIISIREDVSEEEKRIELDSLAESEAATSRRSDYYDPETPRSESDIMLSPEEAKKLLRDVLGWRESKIASLEGMIVDGGLSWGDTQVQSAIKDYQHAQSLIIKDHFIRQRFELYELPSLTVSSREDVEREYQTYRQEYMDQMRLLDRDLEVRMRFLQSYEKIRSAGSFSEDFVREMNQYKAQNILDYQTVAGGVSRQIDRVVTAKALELMWGKDGIKGRLTQEQQKKLINETIQDLLADPSFFQSQFGEYIQGTAYQHEAGSTYSRLGARELGKTPEEAAKNSSSVSYETFVRAAVGRVIVLKHIESDWDLIQMRGMDAYEASLYLGENLFANKPGKIEGSQRQRQSGVRQFGGPEGTGAVAIAHHREAAEFYLQIFKHDIEHAAEGKAEQFIRELRDPSSDQKRNIKRLKELYFWNPDKHQDGWYKAADHDYEFQKLLSKIQRADGVPSDIRREIQKEIEINMGIIIADNQGVRGFTPAESSWRIHQKTDVIKKVFTDMAIGDKDEEADSEEIKTLEEAINKHIRKFNTGARARTAFADLKDAKQNHYENDQYAHPDRAGETTTPLKKFKEDITEIAAFNPQAFAQMLFEMKDETFFTWFNHEEAFTKTADETLIQMDLIVFRVNALLEKGLMTDDLIREDRARMFLYAPLDFSKPDEWNEVQKKYFREALESMSITTPEAQEQIKKQFEVLYTYITDKSADDHHHGHAGHSVLETLGSIVSEEFFAHAEDRIDDRFDYMNQHTKAITWLSDRQRATIKKHSDLLAIIDEKDDPFKRYVNDNKVITDAGVHLAEIINAEEEELTKIMVPIYRALARVYGRIPAAMWREEQETTWNKMRMKFHWYTSEGKRYTTRYQKYSGDQHAPVRTAEDVHEMQNKHNRLMHPSDESIPGVVHVKERHLRVSNWDSILKFTQLDHVIRKMGGEGVDGEKFYQKTVSHLNDMMPSTILRERGTKLSGVALGMIVLFLLVKIKQAGEEELLAGGAKSSGSGKSHAPAHA